MKRFDQIDHKLIDLAKKLNAELTKDRPEYPEALRTFEERRIDWIDGGICKAIFIQPTFEAKGVNSAKWNVVNVAWRWDRHSKEKLKWVVILVDKADFGIIEKDIDNLLSNSVESLGKITMADLR